LYCDARSSNIPFRTQLKLSGSYPLPYGVQISASFQSIPGYQLGCLTTTCNVPSPTILPSVITPAGLGTVWLISPTTRYAANCLGPCTPGALVIPNMTAANLSVPLVPPGTEYADRVNQLDVSLAKWVQVGKTRVQPQIDVFNVLNRSDVLSVRSQLFTTASYNQPSSVLQGQQSGCRWISRAPYGQPARQRRHRLAFIVRPELERIGWCFRGQDLSGCHVDRIERANVHRKGALRAIDDIRVNCCQGELGKKIHKLLPLDGGLGIVELPQQTQAVDGTERFDLDKLRRHDLIAWGQRD
jgi:hypothetical protein